MDKDEIVIPTYSCAPDHILKFIKGKQISRTLHSSNINTETHDTCMIDATLNDPCDKEELAKESVVKTQWALAALAIQNKKVTSVPERQSFIIEGSRGDSYAVKLFPNEKCQCPATNTCYHIIAAKMSIGMDPHNVKGKVSLTQLRKNSRKRVDKKSGRKKPRLNDYDLIPAADSSFTLNDSKLTSTPVADSKNATETARIDVLSGKTKKKTPKKDPISVEHKCDLKFTKNPGSTNIHQAAPVDTSTLVSAEKSFVITAPITIIDITDDLTCYNNNNSSPVEINVGPSIWKRFSDWNGFNR
jgi:hypothetical protein